MKKILAIFLLSVAALVAVGCAHPRPVYAPPPPGVQIHDQGIHDGFEAARHDVEVGHPPNFAHHPRYRNPPVPGPAWSDYRNGFRQGYEQFLHRDHLRRPQGCNSSRFGPCSTGKELSKKEKESNYEISTLFRVGWIYWNTFLCRSKRPLLAAPASLAGGSVAVVAGIHA